jgi:hypothetical protein
MNRIALLILVLSTPIAAHAEGFSLSMSAGSGYRLSPSAGRINTNIMVAPGFDLLGEFLRLEVGFVADLPDIRDTDFDVQLRPMAVLNLPVLPIYVRVVTGVTQLVQGPIAFAFGGAAGIDASVGESIALFAEAGFVPRADASRFHSVFEGRLGVRVH